MSEEPWANLRGGMPKRLLHRPFEDRVSWWCASLSSLFLVIAQTLLHIPCLFPGWVSLPQVGIVPKFRKAFTGRRNFGTIGVTLGQETAGHSWAALSILAPTTRNSRLVVPWLPWVPEDQHSRRPPPNKSRRPSQV